MTFPASSEDSDVSPTLAGWWTWAELGLILCVFFLAGGDPPPDVNEPHYLCRLKHAVDPAYCPGDLFLESPDAHLTFVWAFAWLTHFLTLPVLAWLGRLGTWIALAWAWQRLSWSAVPRPFFSVLGAAVMVTAIAEGNFAGEWLIGGFEAKPIAYVFVLLGLRAWVLNKWNLTWIFLGIASAWHALVGGWTVLILFALWLFGWRREAPFRSMAPGLLAGGLISLMGVLPALTLNAGKPAKLTSKAAEIYVFERLPHHLAPLHKPAEWIAERAARHATVVTLVVALSWVRLADLGWQWRRLRDDPAGRVALYACGAMMLAMIGLAIEWVLWDYPARAAGLLRYYWFRLTDVAAPLALALLLSACLEELFTRRSPLATGLLAVTLLITGQWLMLRTWDRYENPVPRSDQKITDYDDWLEVCAWIQENTPRDSLFLTPRKSQSFKWHAERAEVVTYKDVPQDAASLIEWRRRLYDVFKLGGESQWPWGGSPSRLGTPRVQELAARYQFDYVLTRNDRPLMLPVVYRNETYVVYQMTSGD